MALPAPGPTIQRAGLTVGSLVLVREAPFTTMFAPFVVSVRFVIVIDATICVDVVIAKTGSEQKVTKVTKRRRRNLTTDDTDGHGWGIFFEPCNPWFFPSFPCCVMRRIDQMSRAICANKWPSSLASADRFFFVAFVVFCKKLFGFIKSFSSGRPFRCRP